MERASAAVRGSGKGKRRVATFPHSDIRQARNGKCVFLEMHCKAFPERKLVALQKVRNATNSRSTDGLTSHLLTHTLCPGPALHWEVIASGGASPISATQLEMRRKRKFQTKCDVRHATNRFLILVEPPSLEYWEVAWRAGMKGLGRTMRSYQGIVMIHLHHAPSYAQRQRPETAKQQNIINTG